MDASSTADAGFLTIGEVCEELGVTQRALRFYETLKLVAPRREQRRRLYYPTDVERLRAIMKLKSLGLSLREIRELLRSPGGGPYGLTANLCKELIERLSAQRDAVEAALAQLRGLEPQSPSTTVAISTDHGTMQ